MTMPTVDRAQLHEHGFTLLRGLFDPDPLRAEIEAALREGRAAEQTFDDGGVRTRYLPMMCERTPLSLALVDVLQSLAAGLLSRAVLPGRAKGNRYFGDTRWHRDSEHDIASVGCVAYLEPLTAASGALRVVPASHNNRGLPLPSSADGTVAVETEPGDVIVFDEHLIHGSSCGDVRTQWRVDFVVDPADDAETDRVLTWFRQSLEDESANPGYDAARFPTYGPFWRTLDRPWIRRLESLGVYDM